MFGRSDVFATVHGFNVRVKDEREQDKNHLIEAGFEVPLTFEMMDEISPAIARDLFDTIKGEHVARPELNGADLNLSPETQILTMKTHPELDAVVKISGVNLRRIKAKKAEGGSWLLLFTATWTLADPHEAVVMIERLKQGVYLTLAIQAPKLDLQPEAAGESTADVDQGGNVTSITTGRRRGGGGRRGRKGKQDTPEQIGQDQVEVGRQKGDDDGQEYADPSDEQADRLAADDQEPVH